MPEVIITPSPEPELAAMETVSYTDLIEQQQITNQYLSYIFALLFIFFIIYSLVQIGKLISNNLF